MNSNVLELLKILKGYSSEIEKVIENNNIEFDEDDVDDELSVLIENIMCDLKDLDRNIR